MPISDEEIEETEFLDDAEVSLKVSKNSLTLQITGWDDGHLAVQEAAALEEDPDEASDGIPNELLEEEVIDIGALAEVQDKVFEARH